MATYRLEPMGPREADTESGRGEDGFAEVLDQIRQPELVEKEEVSILRQVTPSAWKMLPAVDVALAFARTFLPENDRHDIILWTMKLHKQINTMTDYFKTTAMGEAKLLKHKAVIQEGLEISLAIGITKNIGKRKKFADKPLFFNSHLASALKAVINEFTNRSCLLEDIYEKTNGHWPKVKVFVDRILPLIVGALIATAVYETCISSSKKATESLQLYRGQMDEIEKRIQSIFDRCKNHCKENMLKDLNEVLDSRVTNEAAVSKLSALMSEKYDWLLNYCIVCDESIHLNYCFTGNHVKSLERNGRFGVIFYRDVLLIETFEGEKRDYVASVLMDLAKSSSAYTTAEDLCKTVAASCRKKGIEVCACAVMRPRAALQWISYYGTQAMLDYGTSVATLKGKGSCRTICENWLNDPSGINPLYILFPSLNRVATRLATVDAGRERAAKARYFFVLYK